MLKERDHVIDYLKCIAAILITNSHLQAFDILYPFATGGALGDVVFLFCSGYTLFLGKIGRFDNWYKRRLMRIFPPVFCWGLLSCIFFSNCQNMQSVMIYGGGWFVQCILIYYVVAYFIRKYAINQLLNIFICCSVISVVWFLKLDKEINFNIYGWNYCKWMIFFLVFLLGAMCGKNNHMITKRYSSLRAIILFVITSVSWYAIMYLQHYLSLRVEYQILSVIPLCYFPIALYNFISITRIQRLLQQKYINVIVLSIGGLCYEIYLVQGVLFHKVHNFFELPYSVLYICCLILLWAYILHVFTNFCNQTISNRNYDWHALIKI